MTFIILVFHQDAASVIRRIAEFLGLASITDVQLNAVIDATSFKSMRDNPITNYSWWADLGLVNKQADNTEHAQFMRKGWKLLLLVYSALILESVR